MTGVEVIVAALAAGAGAGTGDAAKAAVVDAYTGLRDGLSRLLAGRVHGQDALDGVETEPGVWQARIGAVLADVGADRDAEILAAARRLLGLVDPVGSQAGRYTVNVSDARGVQVGDDNVQVNTNYGATAHTMTGPVSIAYGQLPVPPAAPGA